LTLHVVRILKVSSLEVTRFFRALFYGVRVFASSGSAAVLALPAVQPSCPGPLSFFACLTTLQLTDIPRRRTPLFKRVFCRLVVCYEHLAELVFFSLQCCGAGCHLNGLLVCCLRLIGLIRFRFDLGDARLPDRLSQTCFSPGRC